MKILEISGCNLASLEGEFRICLDQAPFLQNELFAIRGVTGSGKSTLIDAMCLALYDDTPRFQGRGGPKIGLAGLDEKDRISAKDVRNILHRGAHQGWAQVVFKGVDGQRWRAKWSVARAHRAANGRFKNQELELENLDSQERLPGTRTEVLKAIREKVGLTFEQFRRSVLLAQGEFAAFAKASEDERAGLLEAMTGTEIYAKLSMAAQQRNALEEATLRDLNLERVRLGLLGDEARLATQALADQQKVLIEQGELEQAGLLADLGWYERGAHLERLRLEGEARLAGAQEAFQGAGERRELLARVEAAQPCRPFRLKVAEARARQLSLEQQIDGQTRAQPALEAARKAREEAFQRAQAAFGEALRAQALAKPELDAARALDARLQEAKPQLLKASQEAARLEAEALDAERLRDAGRGEEQRLEQALAKVAQELEGSRGLRPLAQAWARTEQDLRAFARIREAIGTAGGLLKRVEAASQAHSQALVELQGQLAEGAASLAQQQGVLAVWELQVAQERPALDTARQRLLAQRERARKAEAILLRLRAALDAQAAAQEDVLAHAQAKAQAEAAARTAGDELVAMASGLSEAKSALEKAQAAQGLEERRQQLVAGEACPLCGALDHPWAAGSPLAGLLEAFRRQVQTLEGRHLELVQLRATAQTQELTAGQAGTKALKRAEQHAAEGTREAADWSALRLAAPHFPEDGCAPGALAAVQELLLASEEQLREIGQRQEALLQLERQLEQGRRALKQGELQVKGLETRIKALDQEGLALKLQAAQQARDLSNLGDARQGLLAGLEPFLDPADRVALAVDPEALRARLAAGVATLQAAEGMLNELQGQGLECAKALVGQEATASLKRSAALQAEQACQSVRKALEELQEQRRQPLGGRAVEGVETALAERQRGAERALDEARSQALAADKAVAERNNTIRTLQEQLASALLATGLAEGEFQESLATWGGDPDHLEALLAWLPERVQQERAALQQLEVERSSAQAVLDEQLKAVAAHRSSAAPRPREGLEALALACKARMDELKHARGGLEAELRRDDQARQLAATLSLRIQEQETRTRLWRDMNELIGSADGKKFRTYAQSLTLEALVAFANEQLARLNPRYRLQRVPGCELELQVIDQDMGDEIRSLSGLSGGETFLVSLALALGLSSLSSSDTPIESLFIDEGFGTLDAETLETALSVLDELNGEGRQVGIISHVDELGAELRVQILVEKRGGGKSRVLMPVVRAC